MIFLRRIASGRWMVGPCVCFVALAGIHCGRGDDRADARSSTITILHGGDEWTLVLDDYPQHLVYLALVRLDENWEPRPRLAQSWEHSPDYRTWTIRLRTDVRWHDGVPVTAHDVLFSMELWTHPDILYWTAGPIRSFSIQDDFTLTVTFSKPTLAPLDGWSSVYPKHLLEQLDPKEFHRWEFWTHPVGNGPYRYVRHIPKTMTEFAVNPDFSLGEPRIRRVVLKYAGGANALVELLSGNVDAIGALGEADVLKVAGDPRFRVYRQVHAHESRVLVWNHRHPLFRESVVRRALTLAIDRREVHGVLNLPEDTPLFDGIYTPRQFFRGEFGEALPYDPERAKRMLESAGWRDVDGDGIRERNDEEANFTVLTGLALGGTLRTTVRTAIILQEQLRRVGIRMEVQTLASGVRQRMVSGEFDAALVRFNHHPATVLASGWFGEGSPIGYENPELVRLLETAHSTANPEARDRLYREMREIFRADLPLLFLYPFGWSSVVHRRVRGLSSPHRVNLFTHMEDLWLEQER